MQGVYYAELELINKGVLMMAEGNAPHNTQCGSESHDQHLCYLMSQGIHLSDVEEYETLINDPKFECERCGRKANGSGSLCVPVELELA